MYNATGTYTINYTLCQVVNIINQSNISPARKQQLLTELNAFIMQHCEAILQNSERMPESPLCDVLFCIEPSAPTSPQPLRERLKRAEKEETFSQMLLRLIQEKRLTEPEVYNRVFMDRRLFNKIRNTPDYQPKKQTALLLAVALRLNIDETRAFLDKAGYRLSPWKKFDIILEYFITNQNYDVFEINEVLAEHEMPLLLNCD